ncbi:Chloramphenicol acetyltransferase [bioreactor metagenome]|uniref:Chloramphenicol acetyltransferase n=1 Tax=bioreactor metagenome TaxID=1076179 RepID=A0A645DV14_9ZZZZ
MNFNLIDIEHWNRKPYFEHYLNAVRCTYSMTANIEISKLLHEIKLKKLKLYPTLIYILATVVNHHKEFRTCFDESGHLGYWDSMSPSYTIGLSTHNRTIFIRSVAEIEQGLGN